MATYTIMIAKQKGEYFIYPGSTTLWKLNQGDQIQFINTIGTEVAVTVNIPGLIKGGLSKSALKTKTTEAVGTIAVPNNLLAFEFPILIENTAGNPPLKFFGGPKMVPTDPAF